MAISQNEENYLKSILHLQLSLPDSKRVSTNAIAKSLGIQAASATEMMKRLSQAGFLDYERYQGVSLTEKGWKVAAEIIRKHRLWETFLVHHLQFNWSEVHVIAEQLEHIQSEQLINQLDAFLGFPEFDPHGDPIPDKNGKFPSQQMTTVAQMPVNTLMKVCGVAEDSSMFLAYLQHLRINIGTMIKVILKEEFDNSLEIEVNNQRIRLTAKAAENIMVRKLE